MADTTWRLRYPTGATLYTQIEDEAGQVWNGTAFVAFVVADWATYAVATPETPAGSGRYAAQHPLASPAGNYAASHYLRAGGSAASTDPVVGTGDGYWTGTTFGAAAVDLTPVQSGVDAIVATLDGYAELTPGAVVVGTPTTTTVDIALADGGAVPSTFVWRNNEIWFNGSSVLAGGKYPVTTYTRLTSTTARLTFSPPLPLAPSAGDTGLLA